MNQELLDGLVAALERAHRDEEVRVVVLAGEGRGFCSGADLSQQWDEMPIGPNEAVRLLSTMPVPTVARVHGVAAGGGLGLALSCDVTIAARSASFVCTFGPRLGLVPDLGATWHLPNRLGRARALGIALLGDRISAEQAAEWGLIWAVTDDDQLDPAISQVVEVFKRSSPDAMYRIRTAIDGAALRSLSDQLEVERAHARVLIPRNMAEGAAAFQERRAPRFDGQRTVVDQDARA
jgi:2-(1,2-epoxy-1,2-dihydrophenyl)acetyl-CoA isomerase